jgi:hypothetical protein
MLDELMKQLEDNLKNIRKGVESANNDGGHNGYCGHEECQEDDDEPMSAKEMVEILDKLDIAPNFVVNNYARVLQEAKEKIVQHVIRRRWNKKLFSKMLNEYRYCKKEQDMLIKAFTKREEERRDD